MRMLLGVILGAILTVVVAYAYDSSTGRTPNGLSATAADGQAPLVNWDVVDARWHGLQSHMRTLGENFERTLKRHIG
jgi:hypothetical protein